MTLEMVSRLCIDYIRIKRLLIPYRENRICIQTFGYNINEVNQVYYLDGHVYNIK